MTAELAAIAIIVRRHLGAEVDVVRRPALEHQSNALYDGWCDGRHLIVKEYLRADEWDDAPRREYAALQLLKGLDLAPEPVLQAPASQAHGPLVVYEFMAGEMWDRRKPGAAELAQLAEAWLRFNSVRADGLWLSRGYDLAGPAKAKRMQARLQEYMEWAEAAFAPAVPLARDGLRLLAGRQTQLGEVAQLAPVMCFCRADPRFANVIARPRGTLGLVDWEDAGLRDPAMDLADVLTHSNQEDLLEADEWQPFLGPYLRERGRLDTEVAHRLRLYLALFPLFWLSAMCRAGVRRAAEGRLAGWTANGMPINARLRRYLARARAWPSAEFSDELRALEGARFFPELDG